MNLDQLKKRVLVFDLETSSSWSDGKPINIQTNFEDYVENAEVKWFGAYSYKYNKYVIDVVQGNEEKIRDFIAEHDILVGFNNEEFDTPILKNNNMLPDKYFLQVDNLIILGSSTYFRHDGLPFKNRGVLMGYKFKKNSLKAIAEAMELETQKGDIDWNIFFKNSWTPEEIIDIKKYLHGDVAATRQMFDKLWDFWLPFTEFLSPKNIRNLSWIRSSIASLRYKGDCHTLGVEETYSEKSDSPKEEMGGRVIEPKYEEARNVWYLDYGSLYPWIRNMFCIDNEVSDSDSAGQSMNHWHGNALFKVKGYYDISHQSPIALKSIKNLTERTRLKKEDSDNPLIYTIKIYENAGYGAMRSEIFEQIHSPNAGWDICWLGQQLQEYTEKRMLDFGFETIAGDTDSIFVIAKKSTAWTKEYVKQCLSTILNEIKANVPFPSDIFNIDIENFLHYAMWPFSMQPVKDADGNNIKKNNRLVKVRKGKKKNYMYIYEKNGEKKLKLVGLPIIKDNATKLGPKILKNTLEPEILAATCAKFPPETIKDIIKEYLDQPENLGLLAREFKVKPFNSYKKESQIQAQISRGYFNDQDGVISLIKNKVCGNAGKTAKYCTVDEAVANNLSIDDIDLTKLNNELEPFCR